MCAEDDRLLAQAIMGGAEAAASLSPDAENSARLFQMLSGFFVSQCLGVAANLKVADALADGPLYADALAAKIGAHADNLGRILRALASVGVFHEDRDGRFSLTPIADLLRSDHPQSQRAIATTTMADWNWSTWAQLLHSAKSGDNASHKALGMPMFEYLRLHPEQEEDYSNAMRGHSIWQSLALAELYPFAELDTIVDVGGAHGHLLEAVLAAHPNVRGVLFDQPQVLKAALRAGALSAPHLRDRVSVEGGDFFAALPAGADGYVLKLVLHDWDDEKCVRILSNCRDAMAQGGRVLVVENVIKGRNQPDSAKFLDVLMMLGPGGRERTEEEFRRLFADAKLSLRRVFPTKAGVSVLEAVCA